MSETNSKELLTKMFSGKGSDVVVLDDTKSVKEDAKTVEIPEIRVVSESGKTSIGKGTTFIGEIKAIDELEIEGSVTGNVSSNLGVTVRGSVAGDVSGEDVILSAGIIKGNVDGTRQVLVAEGAKVVGNISGNNVVIQGAVKGNVSASVSIEVSGQSYIKGDLNADKVSVAIGAFVDGKVSMTETDPIGDDDAFWEQ